MIRFTIRDVLWLTVVAALAAGWACDRVRLVKHYSEVDEKAESMIRTMDVLCRWWNAIDPDWRTKYESKLPPRPTAVRP
jgi:hypothetical protein